MFFTVVQQCSWSG